MDNALRRRLILAAKSLHDALPRYPERSFRGPLDAPIEFPYGTTLPVRDVVTLATIANLADKPGWYSIPDLTDDASVQELSDDHVDDVLRIGAAVVMLLRQIELRASGGASSAERVLDRLVR